MQRRRAREVHVVTIYRRRSAGRAKESFSSPLSFLAQEHVQVVGTAAAADVAAVVGTAAAADVAAVAGMNAAAVVAVLPSARAKSASGASRLYISYVRCGAMPS